MVDSVYVKKFVFYWCVVVCVVKFGRWVSVLKYGVCRLVGILIWFLVWYIFIYVGNWKKDWLVLDGVVVSVVIMWGMVVKEVEKMLFWCVKVF